MSLEERTGTRDLTYSRWHRPSSMRLLVGALDAARLTAIDLDFIEYHPVCRCILALVETQRSERRPKPAAITQQLASRIGVPAYSLSYRVDQRGLIDMFWFRELAPNPTEPQQLEPTEWALLLVGLRSQHVHEVD